MRDHQRRAPARKLLKRMLDVVLGDGVQRAGRLVENQHGRVFEEQPRDRHALLLPAGEHDPPLADLRVVAVAELQYLLVDMRVFRRLDDLLVGGVDAPVADVFQNAAGKEEHVLLHDADVLPQRTHRHLPRVHAVDGDRPAALLIKPRQQVAERGLSAAARADQREGRPRGDIEVHVRKHALPALVGKRHVVKADVAAHVSQCLRVRAILDLRLDVHDFAKAAEARHAEDIDLRERGEALERLNKRRDVERKRDEQDRVEVAFVDQKPAERQHHEVEHRDEELHPAAKERHIMVKTVLRVDKPLVAALKLLLLISLVGKRLCHARAGDRRLDIRVDLRDAFLHLEGSVAHLDPEPHDIEDRDGHDA